MIDPFSTLFHPHATAHVVVVGDLMPGATGLAAANGVMIVGIVIIVATTCWALGGLSAGVWVRLNRWRDRSLHTTGP